MTEQEFQVLLLLARHPGRALSFEDISQEALHTPTYGHTEALRSAVKRLRRKLVGAGVTMRIEAVRGYGFRLDPGRARLRSEPTDRTA